MPSIHRITLGLLVALGCNSPTRDQPQPASDGGTIELVDLSGNAIAVDPTRVCENLTRLGCPEGNQSDCPRRVSAMPVVEFARITQIECLLSANSKAAARGCATSYVECP